MRLIFLVALVTALFLPVSAQWGAKLNAGDVLKTNTSGAQGDYHVEYWKKNTSQTGSMTLGEGGNFSCEWGYNDNILFRKGRRPGSRDMVVTYEADYQPQGNSYLSVYGWFDDNPLVEYYIIESYGNWNPASDRSRTAHGSVESDGGTYDIFENPRNDANIHGSGPFTQYWSIRKTKRTSGTITCANHFAAWEKAGMKVGKFYEVSFNVEAYQSNGGKASVVVAIDTGEVSISTPTGFTRSGTVITPLRNTASDMIYNVLGQRVTGMQKVPLAAPNGILLNSPNHASGVYFTIPQER